MGLQKRVSILSIVFDCIYKFVVCVCKYYVVRSVYLGLLKLYNHNNTRVQWCNVTKINGSFLKFCDKTIHYPSL